MSYKFLEHTADVKFQATGKTIEEAFKGAFQAMQETITKGVKIKSAEEKNIEVGGKDFESLLYKFLEEFLYLLDAENFLASDVKKIKINTGKFRLNAVISGDKASSYKFTNDVKAITYNKMFVKKEKNKFIIQAVLDV